MRWFTASSRSNYGTWWIVLIAATAARAQGDGDASPLWVVGGHVMNTPPSEGIHTSRDRGDTWSVQNPGTAFALRGIQFVDDDHGWAAGDGGRITRTTDGGATWAAVILPNAVDFLGVWLVDRQRGWICGTNGTIRRTTDGGANWSDQTSGTAFALNAIRFLEANHGWAVGEGGRNTRTVDGGANWAPQITDNLVDYHDVAFLDEREGYAVGAAGTVIHSMDCGATWVNVGGFTDQNLHAVEAQHSVSTVEQEEETWVVDVSVKWILDGSGRRSSMGYFTTDAQIRDAIEVANSVPGACLNTE